MKLLLCGHGYLGQAISREFLTAGWDITATSLSGGDGTRSCDLSSAAQVAALADEQPDFLVHCAASGRGGPEAYRAVYLEGCRHLVATFPGIPLLFTSSTSVYAQTDGSVVTEDSDAEPDRETGLILRETEELVLASSGIVTRLAGIYGPHRSVILKKFLNGEAVIEEDGRRYLNQIHRDDAARAILHLASSPSDISDLKSQIYNVGDSHPLTQLEVYTALASIFEKPLPPSGPRDLNRKRGWTHKRVSNAKLRATGWEPLYPSFLDAAPYLATTL
ncbi:sugar nucleotide-binding protein [Luteolibacter ambystomatis]|uniref:Sugar nucleotide-binding protein n=1 Tax=Luteolibacter ambystomatis TaxID=2824561 RepID=A0A975G6J9_9BACT|nr:NAD-dependent epimerase/dehydratase family protein [Luteolibacter ambystomatis]QUE49718.1 sugar nucleotide-binding protein [Luteolibacter ambystomatis]